MNSCFDCGLSTSDLHLERVWDKLCQMYCQHFICSKCQRQRDKVSAAPGKRACRRKAYQASADRRFKDAKNLWDKK